MGAGHAARAGQQAEVRSKFASGLPECSRMEIQSGLTYQCSEIDINRPSDPVPTNEPIISVAVDVGEIITDILKIEPDASFEQVRPNTTPVSQEMTMRTLARLMAVGAT